MISLKLEGGAALDRKLLALETKVAKRVVKKAVRAAQKPTLQAAKANAMSMVGGEMGTTLKKNLVVKAFKKQKRGSYGLSVQLRDGIPDFFSHTRAGQVVHIPTAIEYGHDDAAAIPFMRAASDSTQPRATGIFMRELTTGINAATRGK